MRAAEAAKHDPGATKRRRPRVFYTLPNLLCTAMTLAMSESLRDKHVHRACCDIPAFAGLLADCVLAAFAGQWCSGSSQFLRDAVQPVELLPRVFPHPG